MKAKSMKNKEIPVVYYTDELNDEFSTTPIDAITIDENYNYGDNSFWWRFRHFMFYRVFARPLAFLFLKIKYRQKFVNREVIRDYQKNAYFIFGNHTNPMTDAFVPTFTSYPKDAYIIVNADNVSIKGLGQSTKFLGATPLPGNSAAVKNFLDVIKLRVETKNAICIYPEAHIWPFYTKIRPFLDTSFRYPVTYKTPVFAFTNTYQKRKNSDKPQIVTYIDGPFFADETLSAKEQRSDLRNKVYNAMCSRTVNNNVELVKYIKKEKTNE